MSGHIATSKRSDWCTPPEIYLPVQKFFGQIDLDPCSNPKSQVPATYKLMLEKGEDGLKAPYWLGRVFVNPPYGIKAGEHKWIKQAIKSVKAETIMLIPAAVGTKRWQKGVFPEATMICFLKSRVRFQGAKASAPMNCALVYFGENAPRFREEFSELGWCI